MSSGNAVNSSPLRPVASLGRQQLPRDSSRNNSSFQLSPPESLTTTSVSQKPQTMVPWRRRGTRTMSPLPINSRQGWPTCIHRHTRHVKTGCRNCQYHPKERGLKVSFLSNSFVSKNDIREETKEEEILNNCYSHLLCFACLICQDCLHTSMWGIVKQILLLTFTTHRYSFRLCILLEKEFHAYYSLISTFLKESGGGPVFACT